MTHSFVTHFREHPAWSSHGGTHVRGTAFLGDEMLDAPALCRRFDVCEGDVAKFRALLDSLNGFFAVVHVHGETLLAAVDIIRSIPLFYGEKRGQLFVSDDARWVRNRLGHPGLDPDSVEVFRLVGYVTDRHTLYRGLHQIRAGEFLDARTADANLKIDHHTYFRHLPKPREDENQEALFRRLDNVMTACGSRLAAYAAGRSIAIPLSAGYDSRLIALTVKRSQYPKILAFSFGTDGNAESAISREVAERIGIDWRFVEYTVEKWAAWQDSEERRRYYPFADGLCTLPGLQDWPAVATLKERGDVPSGSVFCPGYAADLPTGVFSLGRPSLYLRRRLSRRDLTRIIVEAHYGLWPMTPEERARALARVDASLDAYDCEEDPSAIFEDWFTSEKVAKYVVNTVRIYEFHGMDWWLPFFDREFVEFWLTVPKRHRMWQRLYSRYVDDVSRSVAGQAWPSRKNSMKSRVHGAVRDVLRGSVVLGLSDKKKRERLAAIPESVYRGNPIGLWGRVPYELFSRRYTGRENVNSFYSSLYLQELEQGGDL